MKKTKLSRTIGLIAGAGAALTMIPHANAAGNPFGLSQADGATIVVAEAGKKGISVLQGKCGAGKCGAQRIRQMMDRNADGKIDRDEYVSWANAQAVNEFEKFAGGAAAVDAHEVFEHYQSLEFHNQG